MIHDVHCDLVPTRGIQTQAHNLMGGTRLELVTSTMSTWRSNQLS